MKSTLKPTTAAELEKRLNDELSAQYMYRSLSNTLKFLGYFGFAKFFTEEAEQEGEHYEKLAKFLLDSGVNPTLKPIDPIKAVEGPEDALDIAYEAERKLQVAYEKDYANAIAEPTVQNRLRFYLHEQKNSVAEYADLIARFDLVKGDKGGVLIFDQELSKRKPE
jgi:ferritin